MTTVTVYRSTDTSAPSLTGQVGSLTSLLNSCLVVGYGSQPAAGWSSAYSSSYHQVYRNSTTDGTGFYLNVDDSGSGSGSSREALMTGFQSATGVGTGTGQFPTSSQLSIGIGAVVCRKSNTADSTVRSWTLIADDTVFYLFTESGDYNSPTLTSLFMFGDFFSYAPNDSYRCMIIGRNATNTSNSSSEWVPFSNGPYNGPGPFMTYSLCGHFIAASYTGVGGSIIFGKHIDLTKSGHVGIPSYSGTSSTVISNAYPIGGNDNPSYNLVYPNPADSGLYLSPIWIHHSGILRGYFKGLWGPVQAAPLSHNDTFSGTNNLAGKSFLAQYIMSNYSGGSGGICEFMVETSSTWS